MHLFQLKRDIELLENYEQKIKYIEKKLNILTTRLFLTNVINVIL